MPAVQITHAGRRIKHRVCFVTVTTERIVRDTLATLCSFRQHHAPLDGGRSGRQPVAAFKRWYSAYMGHLAAAMCSAWQRRRGDSE